MSAGQAALWLIAQLEEGETALIGPQREDKSYAAVVVISRDPAMVEKLRTLIKDNDESDDSVETWNVQLSKNEEGDLVVKGTKEGHDDDNDDDDDF